MVGSSTVGLVTGFGAATSGAGTAAAGLGRSATGAGGASGGTGSSTARSAPAGRALAAVDQPSASRELLLGTCEPAQVQALDIAAGEQPLGRDRNALGGERGDAVQQLHEPGAAGAVERDGEVVTLAEDLVGQPGQHRARPDLDEQTRAGVVHRLDLGDELDRFGEVLAEHPRQASWGRRRGPRRLCWRTPAAPAR